MWHHGGTGVGVLPGLLLTGLIAFSGMGLGAQEFQVNLEREREVRFVSDAPLDDFEGVTSRIDGFLYLAGDGLGGETDLALSQFYFEVDLASIDTGIGLRNRHMRENYLETDQYPFASFQGKVTKLQADEAGFSATAQGVLSIHGVERQRSIDCTGAQEGGALRVRCAFQVVLSDHDIPIPKLMFMKIEEVVDLTLDFFLNPAGTGRGA